MSNRNKITWLIANNTAKSPLHHSDTAENLFCAHRGTSMHPTLSQQDLLEITAYHDRKPAVGDVVFFLPTSKDGYIVHRIIGAKPEGFLTRGDNSNINDPWILNEKDIYGRVIAAHQGSRRRKIAGGFWGRMTGMACFMKLKTNNLTTRLLGPVYRSLCTGGILNWLNPVRLTPQVATYRSGSRHSHKLLLGKKIIGTYDYSSLQWQIRRPYRLFVDENSLPVPR